MRVQIDEAGRDHQAGGVDRLGGIQRRFGNRHDGAVANADVADRIEAALRIHHPPAGDDKIQRPFGDGIAGVGDRCRRFRRLLLRGAGRPGQRNDEDGRRPAVSSHHHNPSTLHHAMPTVSQTARFRTETMNPALHQSAKLT